VTRDCRVYLEDILEAINHAEQFINAMPYEDFIKDTKTVFAVTRAVEIIGEAAKNVPHFIRERDDQIPWRLMAGMRDKLAHEYFGINLRMLWDTVKTDLPALRLKIRKLLDELATEDRQK